MYQVMKDFLSEEQVRALFLIAQINVTGLWRRPNQYITYDQREDEQTTRSEAVYRESHPWWLVRTEWGMIEIGPRKRVIEVDWSDTKLPVIFQDTDPINVDNVTNDKYYFHAWDFEKLVIYLICTKQRLIESATVRDQVIAKKKADKEAHEKQVQEQGYEMQMVQVAPGVMVSQRVPNAERT